jgi:hypothetical protein
MVQNSIKIENISEMRRSEGIYDADLYAEIQTLQAGECVRLTFLTGVANSSGEIRLVRITSIKGDVFRGKLFNSSALDGPCKLPPGSLITFSKDHIHSIARERPKPNYSALT